MITKIKKLIKDNKLNEALKLCQIACKLIKDKDLINQCTLFSFSLEQISRDKNNRIITDSEYRASIKALVTSVLSFTDRIEPQIILPVDRFKREYSDPVIKLAKTKYFGVFWFLYPHKKKEENLLKIKAYNEFISKNIKAAQNEVLVKRVFPIHKKNFTKDKHWSRFYQRISIQQNSKIKIKLREIPGS